MDKIKSYIFLPLCVLLLTGCATDRPAPSEAIRVSYEAPEPEWYAQPPESDEKFFYAVGEGNTTRQAETDALARFKRALARDTAERLTAGIRSGKGIYRYLTPRDVQKVRALLEEAGFPHTLRHQKRLSEERYVVLVAIDKEASASPLKKETLRRLVSVEERWHAAMRGNPLERYILAEASLERMRELLPVYFAADAISPFSDAIRKRVEEGTPYFDHTAKRLKKRLKFCVEPVRVPALRLFANAVEKGLETRRLVTTRAAKSSKEVLCITVTGKLLHDKKGELHRVDADITLKLHERYKAPILTQRYRVRGVSDQSGTAALERAAEALKKEVERRFLLSV
jgi:hypothetical protein